MNILFLISIVIIIHLKANGLILSSNVTEDTDDYLNRIWSYLTNYNNLNSTTKININHNLLNTRQVIVPLYSQESMVTNIDTLNRTLNLIASGPRHSANGDHKTFVRGHIIDRFHRYCWQTSIQEIRKPYKGINIIGILPGKYHDTSSDRIILIGAHYDSVEDSPGADDNGSGIVGLLETLKIISEENMYTKFDSTFIFVAFDLSEEGLLGSIAFINNFLTKNYPPQKGHFVGAYIIDGILNYDPEVNSQIVPISFGFTAPEASIFMRKNNFRGDFVAIFLRKSKDNFLYDAYKYAWDLFGDQELLLLPIELTIPTVFTRLQRYRFSSFLRSDHAAFWLASNFTKSFNAVLITDTGPHRGVQRGCYHSFCDNVSKLATESNLKFMKRIIETLAHTCINLSYKSAQKI